MKKILVVNMNYLGDALLTTPILASLRRQFPDAQIDTVAGSRKGYGAAAILATNTDVNRVIPRVPGGAASRVWQLFRLVLTGRYDHVVVLPSIGVYIAAARLAGAKHLHCINKSSGVRHLTDLMFTAIDGLVAPENRCEATVLPIPADTLASVKSILDARRIGDILVGLNLGASRPQKRWPISHFAETISEQLDLGRSVALFGGEGDLDASRELVQRLGGERKGLINLVGKTNLMELSASIFYCSVLVSADTGAMHIATAVHTPLAALFGSTAPEVSGPYHAQKGVVLTKNLSCSPCNSHPTCNGAFGCMSEIIPAEVNQAILTLLEMRVD